MRNLPIPGVFATRWHKSFQAYCADKRGLAAVEFAMIAMPFFLMIFGTIELAVIFIMQAILDNAAAEASRQIRTGQLQTAGLSQANMETRFKDSLGDELFGLLDPNKVIYDVQTFTTFGNTGGGITYDTSTDSIDQSGFGYNFGGQNDIVVVRVFYEWDLIIPVLSAPLKNPNLSDNKTLLQATVAFRNEPFGNS
ncbi:MAG: pilus assembly protein [Henriciella sp.]|nr:pilus assembly protein [Henriciella sp.]